MKVLSLDTSTLMSTCAIIEDGNLLGEYSLNRDMSHSERLVPMIKSMLAELDVKLEDIDLYTVAIGPGSFTGLRIGSATIKGFAHVFNKPVVGVSTIEGLAYNMPYNEIVVPLLDARRNRVFTGIYSWEKEELTSIERPFVEDIDILLEKLESYPSICFTGDGAKIYREKISERFGDRARFAKLGQEYCRAVSIAELGVNKYKNGDFQDFYSLVPEYLRMSQAERQKEERAEKNGN